jgi:hypothetical protein
LLLVCFDAKIVVESHWPDGWRPNGRVSFAQFFRVTKSCMNRRPDASILWTDERLAAIRRASHNELGTIRIADTDLELLRKIASQREIDPNGAEFLRQRLDAGCDGLDALFGGTPCFESYLRMRLGQLQCIERNRREDDYHRAMHRECMKYVSIIVTIILVFMAVPFLLGYLAYGMLNH